MTTANHKKIMEVVAIPISMINREESPAPAKGFIEDIKERGVIQPVCVTAGEGGRYNIVWGRRRIHAAELAGLETVPGIIKEKVDDINVMILIENHQRSANIGIELKALKALIKKGDLNLDEIADMLHLPKHKLKRIYRLDNLSDANLDYLCKGHITESKALQMARLPREKQDQLITEHGYKLLPTDIQAAIKENNVAGAENLFSGHEIEEINPIQKKLEEFVSMATATGRLTSAELSAIGVLRDFVNAETTIGSKTEGGNTDGIAKANATPGLRSEGTGRPLRMRGAESAGQAVPYISH